MISFPFLEAKNNAGTNTISAVLLALPALSSMSEGALTWRLLRCANGVNGTNDRIKAVITLKRLLTPEQYIKRRCHAILV